jgi:hypothetical protein
MCYFDMIPLVYFACHLWCALGNARGDVLHSDRVLDSFGTQLLLVVG